jgi:hypothetical protein
MGLLTPKAKAELMCQMGKLAGMERSFSEEDTPENRAFARLLLSQTLHCLERLDEMEARFGRRFNKRDRTQLLAEWAPLRQGLLERRGFYAHMIGEVESSDAR